MKVTRNDIESVYRTDYPRKLGKADGIKTALRQIKTEEDLIDLRLAIKNYRDYLIKEKKEAQYILYFSTFMNKWKDWLDPNHGESEDFSGTTPPDLSDIFES